MAHSESSIATQIDSLMAQARNSQASGNHQQAMSYAQQAISLAQQAAGQAWGTGSHQDRARAYFNDMVSQSQTIYSSAQSAQQQQQQQQQQQAPQPTVAPTPSTPPVAPTYSLSASEQALMNSINTMMQRQTQDMEKLRPSIFYSLGLKEEANGSVRKMTEQEYINTLTPVEAKEYENYRLAVERNQRALKGELPVSVAAQQKKKEEFAQFKEAMSRAMGSNVIEGDAPETAVAKTTPAIKALGEFGKRWGVVEEAERRGELDTGTSQLLQRMGVTSDLGTKNRMGMMDVINQYGPAITSRLSSMQPYQYYSNLGTDIYKTGMGLSSAERMAGQEDIYNRWATTGGWANTQALEKLKGQYTQRGGMWGGIGTLLGGVFGGIGAKALELKSERKAKKDIKKQSPREEKGMLDAIEDMKTYQFRYKGEPSAGRKRVGMMADEVPDMMASPDGRGIDVGNAIGTLTMAVKALAEKTKRLEKRRYA